MIEKHVKTGVLSVSLLLCTAFAFAQYAVAVTSAGASRNVKTPDTRYIRQAIDQVAALC